MYELRYLLRFLAHVNMCFAYYSTKAMICLLVMRYTSTQGSCSNKSPLALTIQPRKQFNEGCTFTLKSEGFITFVGGKLMNRTHPITILIVNLAKSKNEVGPIPPKICQREYGNI